MALFQPATVTQAYLKMGIYGGAGSGKTYTASLIAQGLVAHVEERIGVKLPVMFLDTETGSNWIKPMMEKAGIEFMVAQTRAFTDLQEAVREAEARNAVLIIDSITHFWIELTLSLAKQRKRKYNKLEFQDYATLKPMWGKFTEAFLNSKAHIIICGRAGNTYEYQDKEDDDGKIKKELITTGTKMKAETEMGYEPSLLVEMVAEKSPDRKKKLTVRKGYILKDRSTLLDGREFINPGFKVFMPHIECLNIGGNHLSFDASRTSESLFDDAGRPDWQRTRQQIEIRLDEIQSIISKHYPGQTTEEKRLKMALLEAFFGTVSWKKIETFRLDDLTDGYEKLYKHLENKSPYMTGEIGIEDIPEKEPTVAKKETVQTTEQSSAVETTTATSATESEIPPVLSTKPPKPRAFGVYDSNGDQYIGGELEMCAQEVCVQLEGMKITERPDYITHNNEVIEAAASESSPFCKRLTQFIKTAK